MPKTIIVEVLDTQSPSLSGGQRPIVTHEHEAETWATVHGGDLLVLNDLSQPLAIYARGVWRRAYFASESPTP